MTLTLNLDPAIVARMQAQATRERRTVEDLVDEALRLVLDPDPPTSSSAAGQQTDAADRRSGWLYEDRDGRPLLFPVFYGGGGFGPDVDPCSNASLLAAAEAEEDARYIRIARGEDPDGDTSVE